MSEKEYVWCLVGDLNDKVGVDKLINEMSQFNFKHLIDKDFYHRHKNERSNILSKSIFVICPKNSRGLESPEIYEALENNCIPIVESSDFWKELLGKNPILQIESDWKGLGSSIITLLNQEDSFEKYKEKLLIWWDQYKKYISSKSKNIFQEIEGSSIQQSNAEEDNKLSLKRAEFFKIKNKWAEFLSYDFLNFAAKQSGVRSVEAESFSCYNPGASIAIVTLYTSEIAEYSIESEYSIRKYCERNNYTFYVYRDSLDKDSNPNWSKPKAILNHIKNHDFIVWIDSDTLIFNPSKKLEDILDKCSSTKQIIACEDIGSNNKKLPKGSLFNSGVVIFKNHDYTYNILKKWWDFRREGDTSSLYSSGGDQEILINIIKKSDPFLHNLKIFPMNKFNTEPRMVDDQTFIIHFMAYPYLLKCLFMKYWNAD